MGMVEVAVEIASDVEFSLWSPMVEIASFEVEKPQFINFCGRNCFWLPSFHLGAYLVEIHFLQVENVFLPLFS